MLKKKLLACSLLLMVCLTSTAQGNNSANKTAYSFIEGIQFSLAGTKPGTPTKDSSRSMTEVVRASLKQGLNAALETFMPFQFKYAILLNESVEKLSNVVLYKTIDDWYGTRYRFGGSTYKGIDCSAFMQVLAGYAFGWMLPRTAREQFDAMKRIGRDDLKEGDFVFFNTRGGVSHVGMYLQNDKFVHSSSSQGVSIGDLNDNYWSARFIGARRSSQSSTQQLHFPSFN
ncbi:MAG: NlpC/P60 family protein [Bacteroidota bacterium]